jgi:hypothetical protein
MPDDMGGWLWIVVDIIGVVILGAAIAYGAMRWKRPKNPTLDRIRDNATERLYKKDDA